MNLRLSFDRYEDDLAVLVTDDKRQINVPRDLLPEGAKPGDLLALTIERDLEGTRQMKRETKRVVSELEDRDPGGDIKL